MSRRGLLLTMVDPPAAMEEEFNAWYDTEHLAERLAIPGFRSARRWISEAALGEGRYLATYELDSAAVLQSPAYLARWENPTPWSKRCMGKAILFKRWACEQIDPGDADPHPTAKALVLAYGDVSIQGTLQARKFVAKTGEPASIALFELAAAVQPGPGARVYRAMSG